MKKEGILFQISKDTFRLCVLFVSLRESIFKSLPTTASDNPPNTKHLRHLSDESGNNIEKPCRIEKYLL